jgi:hypothetical protein
MTRSLSPEHLAALHAGRARSLEVKALDTEQRKRDYSSWSKSNARLWMAWKDNCGRSQCDCEWCKPYRASNAAMPDMRGVPAETE